MSDVGWSYAVGNVASHELFGPSSRFAERISQLINSLPAEEVRDSASSRCPDLPIT
jgi:hypothetical protein